MTGETIPDGSPQPEGRKVEHLFVEGIVAARDGQPYIMLTTEYGVLAQLTLADARQHADDILRQCYRTEMDAMVLAFFKKLDIPPENAIFMMKDFRDFRADQDEAAAKQNAERPHRPPQEDQ